VAIIDLAPARPTASVTRLDAAPRRIGLTLPELHHAAALAGDAPLPFELGGPTAADAMADRLGATPELSDDRAYRAAVGSLPEPAESLTRRGLLEGDTLDAGLAGAVGLLATPQVALDVDVAGGGVRARAWHRYADRAVATLATADGVVFELAWFGLDAWPGELARTAAVSEEVVLRDSAVPPLVDLPFELVDAATEALRNGRGDLLTVLAGRYSGAVTGPDGAPVADADVPRVLSALVGEAQGRLRALTADLRGGQDPTTVGVVSWTLLADGWHALRPHHDGDATRLEVRLVDPDELAGAIAPALAEAAR
jgi:hypothetical protein